MNINTLEGEQFRGSGDLQGRCSARGKSAYAKTACPSNLEGTCECDLARPRVGARGKDRLRRSRDRLSAHRGICAAGGGRFRHSHRGQQGRDGRTAVRPARTSAARAVGGRPRLLRPVAGSAGVCGCRPSRPRTEGDGAAVVITGLGICGKAFSPSVEKQLVPATSGWIVLLGRIGFLARALVFVLIGSFLIEAAIHANSRETKGLAGALRSLEQHTYGSILLGLTAAGFIAFGAYQIV